MFAHDFPERAFAVQGRSVVQLRNTGATLSPFNAFLLLQGLETLAVRLERHEANARAVADYLAADPRVDWVSFAGFPDHPYHELVAALPARPGALDRHLRRRGGYDAGLAFFDSVQLFKRLLNLGDAKSLVIHPASTTHRQLHSEELVAAGYPARDDPPLDRTRAHRRPDRRHRPGAGQGDQLSASSGGYPTIFSTQA